jgi:hypothetical protein
MVVTVPTTHYQTTAMRKQHAGWSMCSGVMVQDNLDARIALGLIDNPLSLLHP